MSKINKTTFKRGLLKLMKFYEIKHTHDDVNNETPAFYWLRKMTTLEYDIKNFCRDQNTPKNKLNSDQKMLLKDLEDEFAYAQEQYNHYKQTETWENADDMLKQLERNMKKDKTYTLNKDVFDAIAIEVEKHR